MFITTATLGEAIRLEADYQLWLAATGQEPWWPTASTRHFIASRLSEFNFMELRLRPIDGLKASTYGLNAKEAKEYARRNGGTIVPGPQGKFIVKKETV